MGNDMVYNGMLFLHILGAMGYVSGLAIIYVCVLGLRRAHTIHTLRLWTGTAARVTSIVVPISGVGVTAMGLYLYIVAWRGTQGNWALVALGAFLGVGLITGAFQRRWIAAVADRAESVPEDATLPFAVTDAAHDPRLMFVANGSLAVVIGVLFLMVAKPDLIVSLLVVGCALVIGLLVSPLFTRRVDPVSPVVAPEKTTLSA